MNRNHGLDGPAAAGQRPARRARAGRPRVGRRVRAVLAALLAVSLVSGCARIPQSSSVREIETRKGEQDSDYQYRLAGPSEGMAPEKVLEGFLDANKGSQESFDHAKEFLTSSARGAWRPEKKTTVYDTYPRINPTEDPERFTVQFQPIAEIDENGLRKDVQSSLPRTETFTLAKENGEYRISGLPSGILISSSDAKNLIEQRDIYFYSPDYSHAVADSRWFLKSPSKATSVVNAILAGPAPHLKGAVATALGSGAKLANPAVAVEDKTAQVDLSSSYWNGLKPLQRLQLKQQLSMSLVGMRGIEGVQLKTDARPVPEQAGGAEGFIELAPNPRVEGPQVAVSKDQLVWYEQNSVRSISQVPNTAGYAPRAPAVSYTKKQFAFLNGSGTQLLSTGPGREVVLAQQGKQLTPPSFDPSNWLWTVVTPASGDGQTVRAVAPGGAAETGVDVEADWLKGYTVTSLRMARDGVRAAVVAQKDGKSHLFLAAVTRADDGVPSSLTRGEELHAGSGDFTSVRWLSDSRLVVARVSSKGETTPTIVGPSGPEEVLGAQAGVTGLSVGATSDDIYLVSNGQAYYRFSNAWYESKAYVAGLNFTG
ncbi:LpqB family beta-propeller domain-containing protein [Arthrobacter sp. UM1]|uniref:LpqB family beta-propeller domain-containing protein n=1 Tax=Arthrobacter sp. UM1 TaxID=2766776 RepID=UPI001CF6AEAE|nr:LpqB family beta-propeller domain-containing protein [Arthrobacter sp. UM1]MCB4207779.1 GerMN domain-containing protein [Arthrobacter sp. UM1]